jgi:cytochrome c oxidase subunit 2
VHTKWWAVFFGVVLGLELLATILCPVIPVLGGGLPENISTYGPGIDRLFHLILFVTAFFFLLTEGLLIYNMWTAAHRPGTRSPYVHGNHRLELTWSVIPGALLLLLAIVQIPIWADVKNPASMGMDKETQYVQVTARQWEWRVRYPNRASMERWEAGDKGYEQWIGRGAEEGGSIDDVHNVNELHVIQGNRVLVYLRTRDVLHSFFLPQLRIKQDALPGKVIPVWFEIAKKDDGSNYNTAYNPETKRWQDGFNPKDNKWAKYLPGERRHDFNDRFWELACAEYCGSRHSLMRGKLYVHKDREDFKNWLKWAEDSQYAPQDEPQPR